MDSQSKHGLCELCKTISIETLDSPGGLRRAKIDRTSRCSLCISLSNKILFRRRGDFSLLLKRKIHPESAKLGICSEGESMADCDEYHLFTDEGDPAVDAGVRIRRRPELPSSPSAYDAAKAWIQECSTTHICTAAPFGLDMAGRIPRPARLIDLQAFPEDSEDVKITSVKDWSQGYATLSYCWGETMPKESTTTLGNIQDREERLQIADLPQTLRDAIQVTRWMSIRYLWIDAVCIIQDSHTDWEIESAKMASIYGNGLVSIAVELSSNCLDGFLTCKPEEQNTCFDHMAKISNVLSTSEPSNLYVWLPHSCRCSLTGKIDTLWETALSERGWTYQERFLAPRILHFLGGQVLWECRERNGISIESDIQLKQVEALHPFPPFFGPMARLLLCPQTQIGEIDLLKGWYFPVVSEFCNRALSHENDKLPAIGGIAKLFHQRLGSTYLAGLWLEDIEYGLCWSVGYTPLQPRDYRAPTWAWPSVDGTICWPEIRFDQSTLTHQVRVEDYNIELAGVDRFGRVSGGWLRLGGYIGYGTIKNGHLVCGKSEFDLGSPFLDVGGGSDRLEGMNFTYLVLCVSQLGESNGFRALILRPKGGEESNSELGFERIGYLWKGGLNTQFDLAWLEKYCARTSITLY